MNKVTEYKEELQKLKNNIDVLFENSMLKFDITKTDLLIDKINKLDSNELSMVESIDKFSTKDGVEIWYSCFLTEGYLLKISTEAKLLILEILYKDFDMNLESTIFA